jgi:hypothetical protein
MPLAILDGYNCDTYDDGVDPTGQSLKEYWTSSAANNQGSSVLIFTAGNGYASPVALTYTPITPPRSSKDVSLQLEPQQLSVSAVTEARKILTLMYPVIGGLVGHGHELLVPPKGRGKLIITLMRERLTGNITIKGFTSQAFIKLFAHRSRLEKFDEHQHPQSGAC